MIKRLVLASVAFVAACSSSSPAVIEDFLTPPTSDDGGSDADSGSFDASKSEEPDATPDSGSKLDADADVGELGTDSGNDATPITDAGLDVVEPDSSSDASLSDAGDLDAAPSDAGDIDAGLTCQVAPATQNVCGSFGYPHDLMFYCTNPEKTEKCPSGDTLIQFNATGTDYASWCCQP